MIWRLLNPVYVFRVASLYFSKSNLEAEYIDDHLFRAVTYKDLKQQKGPGQIIQATDMADAYGFTFSSALFGLICSDLTALPLARVIKGPASRLSGLEMSGPFLD